MANMSSLEKNVVAGLLAARVNYDLFERIGDTGSFSPTGDLIYRAVGQYYADDPAATAIITNIIEERIIRRLPNSKHHVAVKEYFKNLPVAISGPAIAREIRELHKERVGSKLSLALANGASEDDIQTLLSLYQEAPQEHSETDAESLVDPLDTTDLTSSKGKVEYIKLWPRQLNDVLDGGALRGHHILVYARPETGKTLFTINATVGFLKQGLHVLYVGNEEPIPDIRDRIRARMLKTTRTEIRAASPEVVGRLANAVTTGSIKIVQTTAFSDVRKRLRGGTFDVLILDQVRNMRLKSESRTSELEAAGIEARAIAKDYNVLCVSVTQAGDCATGKIYLDMSDVDSSKTGIPASADLMIGLGCNATMQASGLLGISLTKNKLSGLHSHLMVSVNYATGVLS